MKAMVIFRKIGAFLLDLLETVVIALAVFVIIYLFLFQPHQVRGSSMLPNFEDGQYLLTDKISYRLNQPERGDVIVFRAPRNEDYDYIKRIIGLPSESVEIINGQVYVNNQLLTEDYIPSDFITMYGTFLRAGQEVIIPPNQYFVLGDNRSHSSDSREWGFVPRENIIGKAWFRYWPKEAIGSIKKPSYFEISP